MKKSLFCVILSYMLYCLVFPTFASSAQSPPEPVNNFFSVIVPTEFPFYVDSYGKITAANNSEIRNESDAPVVVSRVSVIPKNGWEIRSADTNFGKEPVGIRAFSMKIQDVPVETDGNCFVRFPEIQPKQVIPISVDMSVAAQENTINNQMIAQVVFVVGWAQNPANIIVEEPMSEEVPIKPFDSPMSDPELPQREPEQPLVQEVIPSDKDFLPSITPPTEPVSPVIPEQPEEVIPEFIPPLPPAQF